MGSAASHVSGPRDALAWAKHPASSEAARVVRDLAEKDRRFRAIWKTLLAEGIVSPAGRLLIERPQIPMPASLRGISLLPDPNPRGC